MRQCKMNNRKVRVAMILGGVTFADLAQEMGTCRQTMFNWFKKELPEDKQDELIKACERVTLRKGGGYGEL